MEVRLRYRAYRAQAIQDFVGGRDARRIRDIPTVNDLSLGADHQDGAAQDIPHAARAGGQELVSAAKVTIEIAQQGDVVGQAELIAPCVVGPR